MLKIDDNLLQQIGLGSLPVEEKRGLLSHIYETLEMRVGMRLADQMSNEQLDEFEKYFEAKDDAGAFKWLETNFPNYKEIVNEEFEKLKNEVAQTASQILSASQQNLAAHPLQPQIPGQPTPQPYTPQQPPTQPYQPPQPGTMPPQPQPYAQAGEPTQPAYGGQPTPQPNYQQPANPNPGYQPQNASTAAQPYAAPPQPQQPQQPWPPQQPPAGPGTAQSWDPAQPGQPSQPGNSSQAPQPPQAA